MKNKGFTLIEVMISLIILAIGLLAVGGMQASSITTNRGSNYVTQATLLAQNKLEYLRHLPYTHAELSLGKHTDGALPEIPFSRDYDVAGLGLSAKTVTVTVRWSDPAEHRISLSTLRAN